MIAQLTGRVDALSDGTCVIDVGGVGYLVQASSRTLSALPQSPTATKLLIETHVREDAIVLYGFADSAERDWFRLLTTVQGVGGKVALAILSAMPTSTGVSYTPITAATPADDALSALVNLGYRRNEAAPVVARVLERLGEAAALDALIRDSLKDLAKRAPG